jgi:hypothetical protein
VRGHHPRKITWQLERARLVESDVESTKQVTLRSQLGSAIDACLQVRLKSLQRNPGQLAVEISAHVFERAALPTNNWGVHRVSFALSGVRRISVCRFLLVDAIAKSDKLKLVGHFFKDL